MASFEQPHLMDYLQVVWKRKWLALACLAATVSMVVISDHFAQPVYRATAKIVINKDSSTTVISGQTIDFSGDASEERFLASHYEMIISRPVLIKVVKALGLDQAVEQKEPPKQTGFLDRFSSIFPFLKSNKEETKAQTGPNDRLIKHANILGSKIKINPVRGTRIIGIDVEDIDPRSSTEIANTLADTYIEYDFESNLDATRKMFGLLNEQLLKIRKEMNESQKSLYTLQEKEKIFSVEGQQKVQSRNIDELNAQYLKTKTDKMAIAARIKELDRIAKESDYRESISTIAESVILQSLYKDLIQAQIQLSQLQETSKTKHPLLEPPEIAEIKSRMDLIKEELNKELQRAIDNLKVEYAILENREKTLASTIGKLETEVLKANKVESRYAPLEQEAQANRELYDLLLMKLKESDIVEGMKQANIRVIEPALLPKYPIKPRKTLNVILGAIVGLILGGGAAFFLEYLDRTIRTPMEVKQFLGLPLLCTVPKVPIKGKSGRA